jgi:hypothetical protein
MRQLILTFLFILLEIGSPGLAQNANIVTIDLGFDNEIISSIDPQIHLDYGVTYPLTYEFSMPPGIADLLVYKRHSSVTREVGPVREDFIGTGDSTDLNNAFDEVVMQGGIYYLMCHPSIVEWDKAYTWSHLNHISSLKTDRGLIQTRKLVLLK